MNYRDPNILYRTNENVGIFDAAIISEKHITLHGIVDHHFMRSFQLEQAIVLDGANRFVQEGDINTNGEWRIKITDRDIGKDNSAQEISIFAVSKSNNYIR